MDNARIYSNVYLNSSELECNKRLGLFVVKYSPLLFRNNV